MGMVTPGDIQGLVDRLRATATGVSVFITFHVSWLATNCRFLLREQIWPRLEKLARQPGAQDIFVDLSEQLCQRFAARAIYFGYGAQQATGGDVPASVAAFMGDSGGAPRKF